MGRGFDSLQARQPLCELPVLCLVGRTVAWGKQAETVATYLTKGRPVVVEGRLQLDQWATEAGERRSRLKVVANRVGGSGGPSNRSGASTYPLG